jgi:hypothetical protein
MKYQLIEKNKKHVDAIVKAMKKADALYLATDPDREGEAISWHLHEILKEEGVLDDKPVHRVEFTKSPRPRSSTPSNRRASCPRTSSTRSRRGARSTTWSASTCRRCCGRRCAAGCRPGACRARRCG